jgi:undecaprenyl diphosphate synthase
MAAGPGHRSLKRFLGHQQGAKSVQLVTETASRIGLPWLTLYAFSLENNLRRPRAEVNFLMRLLKTYLESNVQRMMDNNVRMRTSAAPTSCPRSAGQDGLGRGCHGAQHRHHADAGAELRRPLGAGGRLPRPGGGDEAQAHQPRSHHRRGHSPPSVYGAHAGPRPADPDLGRDAALELLLWQIAYAEIFVTERLWPDFRGIHLLEAIADFQRRERRYGGLGEDEEVEQYKIVAS